MRLVVAGGKVRRIKRKSFAGQCVLVLIALQILVFSSYVVLELPTATGHNLLNLVRSETQRIVGRLPETWRERAYKEYPEYLSTPVKKLRYDMYTVQAPVAIFLGYAFGWPIATVAAALFLILGIIGPFFGIYLFAAGGGPDYYTQPGFGYLIGIVVATWLVGKITDGARTSLRQLVALALGIVSLHLVGAAYVLGSSLLFILLEAGATGPSWLPWVFEQVRNLSWYPLPYDAIFGLMLIGAGFPVRYLVGMLTQPDIGLRSRSDILAQKKIEELLH